jgi:hypothetical protein
VRPATSTTNLRSKPPPSSLPGTLAQFPPPSPFSGFELYGFEYPYLRQYDYQPYLPGAAHALLYAPFPDLFRRPPGGIFNGAFAVERGANVVCLAVNWGDAKYRVLKSYREWLRAVSLPNPCTPTPLMRLSTRIDCGFISLDQLASLIRFLDLKCDGSTVEYLS